MEASGNTEDIKTLIRETLVYGKERSYYEEKLQLLCSLLCKCSDHTNHPRIPILHICINHASQQIQSIIQHEREESARVQNNKNQIITVVCAVAAIIVAILIG